MKMSNADIVLNAAERVVKCKLAYICHGYYITAPVFAAVRGGSGFFLFYFAEHGLFTGMSCANGAFAAARTVASGALMLINNCLLVFLLRAQPPPRVRESLGAAALHSNTCFIPAEMFPSESVLQVRVLQSSRARGPDGPVMQQDFTGSGEGGI